MEGFQLYVLFSFLAAIACTSSSVTALSDGETLQAIRDAWKLNQSWWHGDDPCMGWERVQCDADNRVTYLNLSNTGISGPIPNVIVNLDHLLYLDLSNGRNTKPPYNLISANLSVLGSLQSLLHLNLSFNHIQLDNFPDVIYSLTNLISLRLDNNAISGPLPKELAQLKNLTYLYLGNNSLRGPIPKEYGELPNLQELSLWNNYLHSAIPSEFGGLQNLRYLNLHDCSLIGGLPKEMGNLKNLQNISLYRNLLTGTIPETWSNLTSLINLWLANNHLTKSIPTWLLTLPNLYNVSLAYNLCYGGLDLEHTRVPIVSVTCNFLSGTPPTAPNGVSLNWTGNCFDGYDADAKIKCSQSYYNCDSFLQGVPNGSCPNCPLQQFLSDSSTCVCSLDAPTGRSMLPNIPMLIGSLVGAVASIVCVLLIWWRIHKRSTKDLWKGPEGVQRFLYRDLSRATNGFHNSHAIGIGGFGKVFCGVVDGKAVAIKRAHVSAIQSSSNFRNEVILLSRLHHRNLVHLLGFCEEQNSQILVYEYMPNGNLHMLLSENHKSFELDWLKRLDIALGIAQGLEYLHSFADPPVIHRDVKPSNVLLDENMVAKLSDFGISKVAQHLQTQVSTRPAGTVGYIDPQYILKKHLTTASDVYSYGMVLLELATGQKSIDSTRVDGPNLVEWARFKFSTGSIKSIVDPRLGDHYPTKIYHDIIKLAIDCASFDSENRPSMKVVVSILDACRCLVAPKVVEETNNTQESFVSKEDDSYCVKEVVVARNEENSFVEGSICSFCVAHVLPR